MAYLHNDIELCIAHNRIFIKFLIKSLLLYFLLLEKECIGFNGVGVKGC